MSVYQQLNKIYANYHRYQCKVSQINDEVQRQLIEQPLQPLVDWAVENNIPEHRLPRDIDTLAQLTTLNLESNQLSQYPESIGNLTQLTALDLGGNQLSQLPDSIGALTQLRLLYLAYNQLSQLPDSIGNLTQLTELQLEGNKLRQIPKSIYKLEKVITNPVNHRIIELFEREARKPLNRFKRFLNL